MFPSPLRLALLGTSPLLLTLGLLAVRRDLNLVGLCPGVCDSGDLTLSQPTNASAPSTAQDRLTLIHNRALHSTLLLGCPIIEELPELLGQAELLLADADIAAAKGEPLAGFAGPIVTVSSERGTITLGGHRCDTAINGEASANAPWYYCASSPEGAELAQQLWQCLTAPIEAASDGGLLTWEQARDLIASLFAADVNA